MKHADDVGRRRGRVTWQRAPTNPAFRKNPRGEITIWWPRSGSQKTELGVRHVAGKMLCEFCFYVVSDVGMIGDVTFISLHHILRITGYASHHPPPINILLFEIFFNFRNIMHVTII